MSESQIDELLDRGIDCQGKGDLQGAEDAFRQALAVDDGNVEARECLGIVLHQTHHLDEALEHLRAAAALIPDDPIFHFNLAEALRASEKSAEALDHYLKAAELDPTLMQAHLPIVEGLLASGDRQRAHLHLHDAAAPSLSSAQDLIRLARCALELGAMELATTATIRAADAGGESPALQTVATDLGRTLERQVSRAAAIQFYQQLSTVQPAPTALATLSSLHAEEGDFDEARRVAADAVARYPHFVGAHYLLGHCAGKQHALADAVQHYQRALELEPRHLPSRVNLATALLALSRLDEAMPHLLKAKEQAPDNFPVLYNLAMVQNALGHSEVAVATAQEALKIRPDDSVLVNSVAVALHHKRRFDESIGMLRQQLQVHPEDEHALCNLGIVYLDRGQLAEASTVFRQALEVAPRRADIYSNLLLTANYDETISPQALFELHQQFRSTLPDISAAPVPSPSPHRRRIRVGYVSPDFRTHSVVFFSCPVLMHHNVADFEIVCYSDTKSPDHVTKLLQSFGHCWRDISKLSHEECAAVMREDKLDILVDLAGHSAGNRLPVFAARVAPIQVTLIGYPNTTGLQTMDYQVTDAILHPPENAESFCTEKLCRLPEIFACYRAPDHAPPVAELPAFQAAFVTFGYFNNLAKLRPFMLQAWAEISRRVPTARFVIQTSALADQSTREMLARQCEASGISLAQIDFKGHSSLTDFHSDMHAIDIGLDPSPFNGHTTSCQMLYMGVPVVTLAGVTRSSRMGAALLSNLDLPELIASTTADYVEIAVSLATDLPRLAAIRASLRQRMERSAIMDAVKYTRALEAAYEGMWRELGCSRGEEFTPLPEAGSRLGSGRGGVSVSSTREDSTARSKHDASAPAATIVKSVHPNPSGKISFSVIVCSRNRMRSDGAWTRLHAHFAEAGFEFIRVINPKSLASGYNAALAECSAPHVILAHDDMEFLTDTAAARIQQQLLNQDILGAAGTDKLIEAGWICAGGAHIFGQVAQPRDDGHTYNHYLYGKVPLHPPMIQAIDGLFIAANRKVFDRVRFDEETFDGFHLYDIDFSYSAYLAGFRIGILRGAPILHESGGNYDEKWEFYRQRFLKKYAGRFPPPSFPKPEFKHSIARDRSQLLEMMRVVDGVA